VARRQPVPNGGEGGGQPGGGTEPEGTTLRPIPAEQIEDVQRLFRRNKWEIERCYGEELTRRGDRAFRGQVVIKLRITPAGRADEVSVLESSLRSETVESCILATIRGWQFPALADNLWLTWPFAFEPRY
jgi:TonB family protein